MKDHYTTLEVAPSASPEVIQQAYKTLVRKYHPDLFHSSSKRLMEERMQAINEAYSILSDPGQRKRYDAGYTRHQAGAGERQQKIFWQKGLSSTLYWATLVVFLWLLFKPLGKFLVLAVAAFLVIRLLKR